jgi:rhodanese-related sulfurtransferase
VSRLLAGALPVYSTDDQFFGWTFLSFVAFCAANKQRTITVIQNHSLMKKLLTFCAAICLTASVYAGDFQDITIKELKSEMAAKQVTLLDANGTESWQNGHIPGAVNFEASESKLTGVLPKDKNALIVAYCGNPKCTAYQAAAKAAKKLGYTNIKHLSAGISGWKDAGEKTEKGS